MAQYEQLHVCGSVSTLADLGSLKFLLISFKVPIRLPLSTTPTLCNHHGKWAG